MSEIQPQTDKATAPIEHEEHHEEHRISEDLKRAAGHDRSVVAGFTGQHADMYAEALEKYGAEGSISKEAEKRLKRKLDMKLLPLLGIS